MRKLLFWILLLIIALCVLRGRSIETREAFVQPSYGDILLENFKYNASEHFKIINKKNPGDFEDILSQIKQDDDGYKIMLPVKNDADYTLTYWRAYTSHYNGDTTSEDIVMNGVENPSIEIIDTKLLGSLTWEKIKILFKSHDLDRIELNIGSDNQSYTKGNIFWAGMSLRAYHTELDDYKWHNKLTSFIHFKSKDYAYTHGDSFGNNNFIEFSKKVDINDRGADLRNTRGLMALAHKLLSAQSSIVITYTPHKKDNGSLISIPVFNKQRGDGINLDIQTHSDKVVISVTIMDKNYLYNVGLTFNPLVICLVINTFIHTLYINGSRVNSYTTNTPVNNYNILGTCPNQWKYLDKKCLYVGKNKGDRKNINSAIKNKTAFAKKHKLIWNNCKSLHNGEIAPNSNGACVVDSVLNIMNKPILINKYEQLSGRLHSIILYKKRLSKKTIRDIYSYIIADLLNIQPPSRKKNAMFKKSYNTEDRELLNEKHHPDGYSINKCLFNNSKLCGGDSCSNVNWNSLINDVAYKDEMNQDCRDSINDYCRGNYTDDGCVDLRKRSASESAPCDIGDI
tara:strand:+ start:15229 stop:16932 length:1704 start_codon:yes stop_codon:yes gene_type:complete